MMWKDVTEGAESKGDVQYLSITLSLHCCIKTNQFDEITKHYIYEIGKIILTSSLLMQNYENIKTTKGHLLWIVCMWFSTIKEQF